MDQLSQLQFAHALAAASVSFFAVFAGTAAGLPWVVSGLELLGLVTRDRRWTAAALMWSRILVVILAAASLVGTFLVVQMVAVWPRLAAVAMPAVGPMLVAVVVSAGVEAAFLTIYQLSWGRMSIWMHWLYSLPVVIAATLAAGGLAAIDAFAGAPTGLSLAHGTVTSSRPLEAMLRTPALLEGVQVVAACIMLAAGIATSYYAWNWLHSRRHRTGHNAQALGVLATTALMAVLVIAATGPIWMRQLAANEPVKLAAMQGLVQTQVSAPVMLGGHLTPHGVDGGVKIPALLSWWGYHDTSAVVQGLDLTPREYWPPLYVHDLFDGLLAAGLWLVVGVGFSAVWWSGRRPSDGQQRSRLALWILATSGPAAAVVVVLGWVASLAGRLPFAVTGLLTTSDAVYGSMSMARASVVFVTLYAAISVITIWILWRMDHGELRGSHG